ncbi:hypothetical protein Tco_0384598 [Tanacetum coccineum]
MLSQVTMKLINVSCVQILNQFDICHKFASLGRKSIQKLGVQLKLFHLNSITADNVPAGRSSSIPADYVSAGHILVPADSDRIC